MKLLISALGAIDTFNAIFITFDLERTKPHRPSSIMFQLSITVKNLFIHHFIIDMGHLLVLFPLTFGNI
jgi:hypothetical protein